MVFKRKPPEGDVRRVRSMGFNLPGVTTNKNGHTVQFESYAERILLVLFERDKTVLDYRSQPETFEFTDEDKKIHRYTPDFKVWKADGSIEIHEVTRTERQEQLRISEREAAARKICQERQWKYIVYTEQTLPQETEATNLLALLRYRLKGYACDPVFATVRECLQQNTSMQLRACADYIAQHLAVAESTVFAALCHLLWHGEICTDLHSLLIFDSAFAPNATIYLPKEEKK